MELEFFYDFVSPYSYLASTRVAALAERQAANLRWRPFLLGGVFKATGNRAPIEVEAKGRHMWIDLQRWAKRLGVPLVRPDPFPVASILALRSALEAERQGKLVPFTHAVYRAYWGEGRDISQPDLLAQLAASVGLDGPAVVAAAPQHKEALARQTQDAVDRGAFGAPTFFVGGEMFVGNDRLELVEDALRAASGAASGA
ncbi:MAG TPA: 2-hydroxychromene-2-carboxylate isomerase [Anaeromyxobacteraceae bacterium]|nr:2-hydroxychromene-2-carboxylate isomerase [Anaeromyxobacteraceae bacterium]